MMTLKPITKQFCLCLNQPRWSLSSLKTDVLPLSGILFFHKKWLCLLCTNNIINNRGSGTEPKLKYYIELHGTDPEQVRTTLNGIPILILFILFILFIFMMSYNHFVNNMWLSKIWLNRSSILAWSPWRTNWLPPATINSINLNFKHVSCASFFLF